MSEGWILAYRSLFDPDHHLGGDVACKRYAWLDLIIMATHQTYDKPVGMDVVTLNRGEVLVSVRYLAERWRWSKSKVNRVLCSFVTRSQIEPVSGTPSGTIYRIVNYDTYQTPTEAEWDTKWDSGGTAVGQRQRTERIKRKKPVSFSRGGNTGNT